MANTTVNKVVLGTETLIDLTDTTATAADVAQGTYFYTAAGVRTAGTATVGSTGSITQDAQGYLVLDDEGDGSSGGDVEPAPWVRPSEWPDLSKMDVSAGDIIYMTSYADEARGFCSFSVTCTGDYTVEVGSISGSIFIADSTQSYTTGAYCQLYYGTSLGGYKVLRVTGTSIKNLSFRSSSAQIIDDHACYTSKQGIVDIVGKMPSGTGMSCSNQYNLINVDISGLRLSGSSSSMFNACSSLASLDVSDWDTSSATSMMAMFGGCNSLTYLDVSGWDMSGVTSTANMFNACTSLTYLDVSKWDTSSVTSMNSMFGGCYSLTYLDVSGWDISSVTNIGSMFNNCDSLASLDVSDWDTSGVTSITSMFSGCYSLQFLDVSKWDTSSVTNMQTMFNSCNSLTSLDVSDWDTSGVTNMSSMFSGCNSLQFLDVSEWDTSSVTSMSSMFGSCYSLQFLDVSGWDTSSVTSMSSMFSNCNSLQFLDVSEWDTSSVTAMNSMFSNCNSLQSLDVSGWDTSSVTNMASMFSNCYSLISLDVSGFDFSKVTASSNASSIFGYCYCLSGSLTLPSSMGMIGNNCFVSCRSLTEWHFLSTTPPTLNHTNAFGNMTDYGGKKIYVPAASLSAYQEAPNWSTYASYMVGE